MAIEIKVPMLAESVSEASVLSWHKKEGDFVRRGENLVDIETDKVVLEVPAPEDGVLTQILVKEGESVQSGALLAYLESKTVANEPSTQDEKKATAPSQPVSESTERPATASASSKDDTKEVLASPAARKIAAEKELDLEEVKGSGRGGRITKEDVLQPKATTSPARGLESVASIERSDRRVPMTKLRQRIAERLLEAQQNAAMLTTFNEVNMQAVINLRQQYREVFEKTHGVRLGFMSFFVKAVVDALKKYPVINASIDGTDIVYHEYYDIGIAVASPRGLVVPVLRNADALDFAEIEKGINEFADKARDGKLTIEELSGGTFTITNGGIFGSLMSTPILNPPQSAILGMHRIQERPIAENGQVVIRPMMYLALSYDHRLIDGREAVLFLVAVRDAIEHPERLLLGV
jgi:2-oxoglutarate dehydrogenase E2 component (dihydrolipoamide succinyltransferase)